MPGFATFCRLLCVRRPLSAAESLYPRVRRKQKTRCLVTPGVKTSPVISVAECHKRLGRAVRLRRLPGGWHRHGLFASTARPQSQHDGYLQLVTHQLLVSDSRRKIGRQGESRGSRNSSPSAATAGDALAALGLGHFTAASIPASSGVPAGPGDPRAISKASARASRRDLPPTYCVDRTTRSRSANGQEEHPPWSVTPAVSDSPHFRSGTVGAAIRGNAGVANSGSPTRNRNRM